MTLLDLRELVTVLSLGFNPKQADKQKKMKCSLVHVMVLQSWPLEQ